MASQHSNLSRVRVRKSTPDSLNILLLPKGPDRPLEVISAFWLFMLALMTSLLIWSVWNDTVENSVGIGLFLIPFWMVGLGLTYTAIRSRYLTQSIEVTQSLFSLKSRLGQWSQDYQIPLDGGASASLEDVLRSPNLIVQGQNGKRPLTTGLILKDQAQLVAILNRYFGVENSIEVSWSLKTGTCSHCGMPIPGAREKSPEGHDISWLCSACDTIRQKSEGILWQPFRPSQSLDLPTQLVVHDDALDHLCFSYPLLPSGIVRRIVIVFFPVGLFLIGLMISMMRGDDFIIKIPFIAAYVVTLVINISLFFFLIAGRIEIRLNPALFELTWGRGPFRFRCRRPVSDITDCRMVQGLIRHSTSLRGPVKTSVLHMCGVIAGEQTYPLVSIHGQAFSQQVVRLIRTFWAERLRAPFPDPLIRGEQFPQR